jgi:hypothetical protein
MSGSRTSALARVAWAAATYPGAKDAGSSGGGSVPTPPGPGIYLVSTGSAPGNDVWETAVADTVGSYAISFTTGTTLHNANTTGGTVAYTLPLAASVPFGAKVTTFLAVSTGANAMTVSPTSTDNVQNADTGAYANTTWSTAPSGNQQGRGVTWVSDGLRTWSAH